ncbi:MAG: hypothetical protein RMJ59_01685 [Candidatus Nitrosocaldus sp.]|nr:hypothetical protein [Candidatus Nitrosocaldus sp.]MCS7140696.1 hypothetical protein [Candidatus Nitrosocaldus sp.]MDW7999489.1 hypothetical protein [Candidatus Nitrosocaldus sp.]MDW8275077.1 hypothetical protein [Candidatus Nitrosocaldus sp.]
MRKEYIVVRIDAAPDGSPYVFVSLAEPRDIKEKGQSPVGMQVVSNFTSFEDLMKNLNRMIASQLMGGFTTTLKLSIREYEESGIKVGDKIYLDIIKPEIMAGNELLLSQEQMQKYEMVLSILSERGIGPSVWATRRHEILAMINKGLSAQEIADAISNERSDE